MLLFLKAFERPLKVLTPTDKQSKVHSIRSDVIIRILKLVSKRKMVALLGC